MSITKPSFLTILFSPRRLYQVLREMTLIEKLITVVLVLLVIVALVWWGRILVDHLMDEAPQFGGAYTEGVIGQPRFINPLIAHTEAGKTMTNLIYNGLFAYDHKGKLVSDLAERREVTEDLKTYTVVLREDALWHDGTPVQADDVVMTVNMIRDVSYQVPSRLQWTNVVKIEKIDDRTVRFILEEPSATFLQNLTVGILPAHIWGDVTAEQFQLSEFNTQPIGTGPYEVVDRTTDEGDRIMSYELSANEDYYRNRPYIDQMTIKFYPNYDNLIAAFNQKDVDGIGLDFPEYIDQINVENDVSIYKLSVPNYVATFFNRNKSAALAFSEVREALTMATDRNELIDQVFTGNAERVGGPLLSWMDGYNAQAQQSDFDRDKANALLDEKGWVRGEDGIRQKDGTRLSFTLQTVVKLPQLMLAAEVLSGQWREIGAEVVVQEHEISSFNSTVLQPREYDAVLFAHQLTATPNLFPFWHSSQTTGSGLNYSLYKDDGVDTLLTELTKTAADDQRMEKLSKVQKAIVEDVPATFLFSPIYLYVQGAQVQGVGEENFRVNQPKDRFYNVHEWFVKTKHVRKENE